MSADGSPMRSSAPTVRNPLLALASVQRLAALIQASTPEIQGAFNDMLTDCSIDSRDKANKSWRTHKPPMAMYWKWVSVNFRHLRLALRSRAA